MVPERFRSGSEHGGCGEVEEPGSGEVLERFRIASGASEGGSGEVRERGSGASFWRGSGKVLDGLRSEVSERFRSGSGARFRRGCGEVLEQGSGARFRNNTFRSKVVERFWSEVWRGSGVAERGSGEVPE